MHVLHQQQQGRVLIVNNWRENDHVAAEEEVSAAAYDPTVRQSEPKSASMDVSHIAYDPTVHAPPPKVNATDRIREERERKQRGGQAIPEDAESHYGAGGGGGGGGYGGTSQMSMGYGDSSQMSGYADASQMSGYGDSSRMSGYADSSQMSMGYANQSTGYAQAIYNERSSNP